MQWVRERRMLTAEAMLVNGMSVTEVSEAIGAANPFSFSRSFKQVTGRYHENLFRMVGCSISC